MLLLVFRVYRVYGERRFRVLGLGGLGCRVLGLGGLGFMV